MLVKIGRGLALSLLLLVSACKVEVSKSHQICTLKTFKVIGLNVSGANFILENEDHSSFEIRIPGQYLQDIPKTIDLYERKDYRGSQLFHVSILPIGSICQTTLK